jgi:transposase-like protein
MSQRRIRVSQGDLHRVHVVRLTLEGRESVGKGAELLGISARQMKRLRRKMQEQGAQGLLHGNRGKVAWNKTSSEIVEKVIALRAGVIRDSTTAIFQRSSGRKKSSSSRARRCAGRCAKGGSAR